MKAYLLWVKKSLASAIGFLVIFVTTINPNLLALIPADYIPYFNLAVGMAATYSVWKLTNGVKPTPTV